MNVRDLIDMLQSFDPDQEVCFAHPSHDYWKTTLVSEANCVDEVPVKHSDYHRQLVTDIDDDYEEDFDNRDRNEVVVISTRPLV